MLPSVSFPERRKKAQEKAEIFRKGLRISVNRFKVCADMCRVGVETMKNRRPDTGFTFLYPGAFCVLSDEEDCGLEICRVLW